MGSLGLLLGSVLNALLIAVIARRLLGVPVGWPRTIALALIVNGSTAPLVDWVGERLDFEPAADGRMPVAGVLIVVLIVAWLVALEVGVLAILEALVPTGTLPGPVTLVRSLPGRWRRSRRYAAIVRIAARHGLGRYLSPRARTGDERPASATARALREALTQGGVTFIKLGQMLSTRPDVVGPDFVAELSRLHSDVPPQAWPEVATTLAAELGGDPATVFASIEQQPLAAASVGQVHRATLLDGRPVVVKVQRSDARAQVTADLDIVLRLASWLDRSVPWARRLGVRDLAVGFAASLDDELDYRVEARNMRAIAATTSRVGVPGVHRSTRRLLVMDAMPGKPLSSADLTTVSDERRRELADLLLDTVLEQVMGNGVFHADLHAGNVLFDDTDDPAGQLSLLDFGSVGRLDRGARTSLGLLLLALDRQDSVAATQALTDLLDTSAETDGRSLEREVGQLVMRHGAGGDADQLFLDLFRLVVTHGLRVPPPVAAAFRALGALEGTLALLTPQTDLISAARERGTAMVTGELDPAGVRRALEDQLIGLLPTLQRLPRQVSSIVDDLQGGRFTTTVRLFQDEHERGFLRGLVQQLVLAILAATTALSGVALVVSDRGPQLTSEVPLVTFCGLVLLLFAFVLGSRVVVVAFRSTWHDARPLRDRRPS